MPVDISSAFHAASCTASAVSGAVVSSKCKARGISTPSTFAIGKSTVIFESFRPLALMNTA